MLADSSSYILFWSVILVAVVIAGLLVALGVRRWLTATDEPARGGFTLSDLRRLYKEGRMSEEEFERAKSQIIGAAKAAPKPQDASDPGTDEGPVA